MILLTLLVWLAGERAVKRPFPGFALGVGALLGLCFLTRIDAVFFIAAVTAWHTLLGFRQQFAEFKRRLGESLVMGLTSMVLAGPWLAYNKLVFGSFMPISGTAQSTGRFGANLAHVPGNLFDYATLVLPVPKAILTSPAAVAMSALAILLYAAITASMARHMTRQQFSVLMIGTLFLLGLAGYYGLFFGAPHFMGRYLSPVSPLLAILTVAIGMVAIHQWGPKLALIRWSSAMIPIIIVGLVLGLNTRT